MIAVISLLVDDVPGVMQRVMGAFTRKRINVETIVVGKCEKPEKARIVLSITDPDQAVSVLEHLRTLQEVNDAELIGKEHHEAYALISNGEGMMRMTGSIGEVQQVIKTTRPERYIWTVNAL